MSGSGSQSSCLDPLDTLLDFSSYDDVKGQTPSLSSEGHQYNKGSLASTPSSFNSNSLQPNQTLSGPSHPYELHKQQTGIPAGGLATTLAINSNQQLYAGYGYLSGINSSADEYADTKFEQASPLFDDMAMESSFGSPSVEPAFFYPELPSVAAPFVNPSTIGVQAQQTMATSSTSTAQQSNVGRLYPGAHQQQALAKSQQQQQMRQRQESFQGFPQINTPTQSAKSKARPGADPIVEEKISQLLDSMRKNSVASSSTPEDHPSPTDTNMHHGGHRSRKDEEDMDEDERLLASEEGKKLSSKERRQLRNKVSARAFRSRRKEYIGQLEGEIATKVNENQRLKIQNQALIEENTRLSDLTRMLLSSPSFSGFLDSLTTNVGAAPSVPEPQSRVQHQVQPQQQQQQTSSSSAAEQRQNMLPKDVNPYAMNTRSVQGNNNNNMDINFAIMPEQPMDFSLLDLANHDFIYQPQVFSVHDVPQMSINIADALNEKERPSSFEELLDGLSEDVEESGKEMKLVADLPVEKSTAVHIADSQQEAHPEFDDDPAFALFNTPEPSKDEAKEDVNVDDSLSPVDFEALVASIKPGRAMVEYVLVDAAEQERTVEGASKRVRRLCAALEAIERRLEGMNIG